MHIVDPVEIARCQALGFDSDLAFTDCICSCLREWTYFDEPLQRESWFNGRIATLAMADRMDVGTLLSDDATLATKLVNDRFPRLESIESVERSSRSLHHAMLIHDDDHLDVMALTHLEVIGVMCCSDLDCSSSELWIDEFIFNDRDISIDEWKQDFLSNQMLIAGIPRMDRYRTIAEHRLSACRSDSDRGFIIAIADLNEFAFIITMFDFDIRERGKAAWTPIDDPLSAIDQTLIVESLEDLKHCA